VIEDRGNDRGTQHHDSHEPDHAGEQHLGLGAGCHPRHAFDSPQSSGLRSAQKQGQAGQEQEHLTDEHGREGKEVQKSDHEAKRNLNGTPPCNEDENILTETGPGGLALPSCHKPRRQGQRPYHDRRQRCQFC